MNHPSEPSHRVEVAGRGLGVPAPSDVERRARELALIRGRTEPEEEDRAEAVREFLDQDLPGLQNEDADSTRSLSPDPRNPVFDCGHQVPEYGGDDEKADLERLALEGVEEAQHDQMLTSRRVLDEPFRSLPRPPRSP